MSNTVVAYYRVSTEKQGKSGLGLESQKDIISKYCIDNKYTIIREFQDVQSGIKAEREGLAKALQLNKETKSILMVAKLDRLTRDNDFFHNQISGKVNYLALDNPTRVPFMLDIYVAVAAEERRMISQRIKNAMAMIDRKNPRKGKKPIGRPVGSIRENVGEVVAKIHHERHLKRLNEQEGLIPLLVDNYHLYTNAITKKVQEAGYKNKYGNPPSQNTVTEWMKDLKIEQLVQEKIEKENNEKLKLKDKVILNGLEFDNEEIREICEEKKKKILARQENKKN